MASNKSAAKSSEKPETRAAAKPETKAKDQETKTKANKKK